MFLRVVYSAFTSQKPIEQKLVSFDNNCERISERIKNIGEISLNTVWDDIVKKVSIIKTGSCKDVAADMNALQIDLSNVVATVKTLQNKILEDIVIPIETKKIDYEFFLNKPVLATIRDAYAARSSSAYIQWPNTCEAFSELARHILEGHYGSDIRELLLGDFFEQGQMLLLVLVDRLQSKDDLASVEIFQDISKEEAACLAAVANALKEAVVPYLVNKGEVTLPEHALLMGLVSRIHFEDERQFGSVIEYYRALYSPTIGQLLFLVASSENPDALIQSLQGTTLSEQKLALLSEALAIMTATASENDPEEVKQYLVPFMAPDGDDSTEKRAVVADLLAVMAIRTPQLAIELAQAIFDDEDELTDVAAAMLAHVAMNDVNAACNLTAFLSDEVAENASFEAAIKIAKRYPKQALQLGAALDLEYVEDLHLLVCGQHSTEELLPLLEAINPDHQDIFLASIVGMAQDDATLTARYQQLQSRVQEDLSTWHLRFAYQHAASRGICGIGSLLSLCDEGYHDDIRHGFVCGLKGKDHRAYHEMILTIIANIQNVPLRAEALTRHCEHRKTQITTEMESYLALVATFEGEFLEQAHAALAPLLIKHAKAQAFDMITTIHNVTLLKKVVQKIIDYVASVSPLDETEIELLLKYAGAQAPHVNGLIRMGLAQMYIDKKLPQAAWKIANLTEEWDEQDRIAMMCTAISSMAQIDPQGALEMRASAQNVSAEEALRLDGIFRLSRLIAERWQEDQHLSGSLSDDEP